MCDQQYTDDVFMFGKNTWVYCPSHQRPHQTGWCTVRFGKVPLAATDYESAIEETKSLSLPIFEYNKEQGQ